MASKEVYVGPVLQTGKWGQALAKAIQSENPGAEIIDRGSYLRVLSPGRCVLRREAVEAQTGMPFRLPGDLESVMSAFKGKLSIDEDEAVWSSGLSGEEP